jgi:type III secretion protein HrpB1
VIEVDAPPTLEDRASEVRLALRDALSGLRLDEAKSAYEELTEKLGFDPDSDGMLPSRVMIGIFDGRVRDMLQMLNDLGEDRALGLKAVCLQIMGDPLWEGLALHLAETSQDAGVRSTMETLLEARKA